MAIQRMVMDLENYKESFPQENRNNCAKIFHIDALQQYLTFVKKQLLNKVKQEPPLLIFEKLDFHYFKLLKLLHDRGD